MALRASYSGDRGETRILTSHFNLPLSLAATVIQPVTIASHKLTLDSNRPPVPLTKLFSELLCLQQQQQSSSTSEGRGLPAAPTLEASVLSIRFKAQLVRPAVASNAHGERYPDHTSAAAVEPQPVIATIIVSKSGGRYRVQSNCLEGLALLTSQLCFRLNRRFSPLEGNGALAAATASSSSGSSTAATLAALPLPSSTDAAGLPTAGPSDPFCLWVRDDVPLADYSLILSAHTSAQARLAAAGAWLGERAHEYRLVLKALLARARDKAPPPLGALPMLLDRIQDDVTAAGKALAECQDEARWARNGLACATAHLLLLGRLRYGAGVTCNSERWCELWRALDPAVIEAASSSAQLSTTSSASDSASCWAAAADASLVHLLQRWLEPLPAASASSSSVIKGAASSHKHQAGQEGPNAAAAVTGATALAELERTVLSFTAPPSGSSNAAIASSFLRHLSMALQLPGPAAPAATAAAHVATKRVLYL